jgi:lipoyl-dependent peroxiredoxin
MNGNGTIDAVTSGAVSGLDVSWPARTAEHGGATSPEELLAASHAACFSMALSSTLAKQDTPPESLEVTATVSFVPGTGITSSVLTVSGVVPGIDADAFRDAASAARDGCPVSGALKGNVDLSVDASLRDA